MDVATLYERTNLSVKKNGPSLCRRMSWTYMYEKAVDKVKSFTALQEQEVSSCLVSISLTTNLHQPFYMNQ